MAAIALRMDDVGAASKLFERYAKPLPIPGRLSLLGNVLFLKSIPPFRAWGPYRELRADEWEGILSLLRTRSAKLTIGVTAAWVRADGTLEAFPARYPLQAALLRAAAHEGLVEIANHGLTHCVLAAGAFRPRLMHGNRSAHREFWEWLPAEVHSDHLRRSQEILQDWLGLSVTTFVPPGNVFAQATLRAARAHGIRVMSCATTPRDDGGLTIIGNEGVEAFHDRDLVFHGLAWLEERITLARSAGRELRLIRELAA